MRTIELGGYIADATFKNGLPHGLQFSYDSRDALVSVFKKGNKIASKFFYIMRDFKEEPKQAEAFRKATNLAELTMDLINPNTTHRTVTKPQEEEKPRKRGLFGF